MIYQLTLRAGSRGLLAAKVIIAIALIATIHAGSLASLVSDWWNDSDASYGMLVPPLALYIAWIGRRKIFAEPAVPDGRGLLLVLGACLMFLAGRVGAEFFIARISFVLLVAGLIWTFWGIKRFRQLVFPLILLAAMVPLPTLVHNLMAAPLQLFASHVSTELLLALGTTVYRDGNIILVPGMALGVEDACSGLRSMPTLIIAALLLGYAQCRRFRTRFLLVAIAIPLAIAVNVLRVTGSVLLTDYNHELAFGFYHAFSSWLVFLVGLCGIWLMTRLLHLILE